MTRPLISLCLPTNGISEWVFPVLDSVFSQNVDSSLFEVVVTDNGNNQDFFKKITDYSKLYSNLIYKKTNAYLFENQIEALRLADGEYLKFLNHRSVLEKDSLQWLLDIIKRNKEEKPVIYFSNGQLKLKQTLEVNSFDEFVKGLKELASWTTGVGVWKEDFEKIPENKVFNKISPHSDVLFAERRKSKYIIDDKVWSHEIDNNQSKKGSYDLYKAFGIEEFSITLGLYLDGDISIQTLKCIKKAYGLRLAKFYRDFSILKKTCSYELGSFNDCVSIFFNTRKIKYLAYLSLVKYFIKNIILIFK